MVRFEWSRKSSGAGLMAETGFNKVLKMSVM